MASNRIQKGLKKERGRTRRGREKGEEVHAGEQRAKKEFSTPGEIGTKFWKEQIECPRWDVIRSQSSFETAGRKGPMARRELRQSTGASLDPASSRGGGATSHEGQDAQAASSASSESSASRVFLKSLGDT